MTISLDAEFRDLVRSAIPEIVDLLWHSELNVRSAGADALLKLSDQGNISSFPTWTMLIYLLFIVEFRESIRASIPQIITLLRPWKSYICEVGANALAKLSEQGIKFSEFSDLNIADVLVAEFRELIRPAIRQIIALLSHNEWEVREAGADALSKLSEQGNTPSFFFLIWILLMH